MCCAILGGLCGLIEWRALWDKAVSFIRNSEVIAHIRGIAAHMQLFYFFFELVGLLRNTDNLSRTLQKQNYSIS